MDSPWYVTQPVVEPLDLPLMDEEIRDLTEDRYGGEPGFRRIEAWREEFAQRDGVRAAKGDGENEGG